MGGDKSPWALPGNRLAAPSPGALMTFVANCLIAALVLCAILIGAVGCGTTVLIVLGKLPRPLVRPPDDET